MANEYYIVDVFTDVQFGGNPLAVVLDAQDLSTAQMQRIAAEFNLAETTFVLPPVDPANTANVRIFTPRAEMPFAGHPNIGTAFVIAQQTMAPQGNQISKTMIFEEIAGLVPIELDIKDARVHGARLRSPQPLTVGANISSDVIAQACSLSVNDIDLKAHQPCVASCGAPFVLVQLKNREALARAQPAESVFTESFPREDITGIHLYTKVTDDSVDIQTRMFAPLHGIPEDPATGSANVALIGLLAKLAPSPDETLTLAIGQGFDMGRKSVLLATAEKRNGEITGTFIGGSCVNVMHGTLTLA